MKFAIIGDIHANLEAFDAVMADAAALALSEEETLKRVMAAAHG